MYLSFEILGKRQHQYGTLLGFMILIKIKIVCCDLIVPIKISTFSLYACVPTNREIENYIRLEV